ncbi:unnamed protein product [Auanema sp. JU1783]|nr:unnamed protein product [Auanema sp. JU1783]
MCTNERTLLTSGYGVSTIIAIFHCSLAVFFVLYLTKIQNFLVEIIKSKQKKPVSPKVASLTNQVNELQTELNKISPTSEFAAYFKKERVLNKLKEELESEVNSTKSSDNTLKVQVIVRTVLQAVGFVVLYSVSGYQAFCCPTDFFWPLNFLLRIPFASTAACDDCHYDATPVSLFNVLYVLFATFRKFL